MKMPWQRRDEPRNEEAQEWSEDVQDWLWIMRQLAPLLTYAVRIPPARVVYIPEQRRGTDGHR